ncbi:MAG: hypothetical protein DCF19_16780 [Pseudanabaena frigida]|uniref:Uncharacterized protein n=1 Tax=Pseudanabaena frigida TaxID=945775 RepID=A0A2W4VZL1_9CYAN|nr:MAG: hypothetical protein DCF19_16780 [Pseudanabaena frigida]
MATHHEFRDLGDQWLISYACTIANMPIPTLFIVGHCLEAYCKAAILKNNPSVNIFRYGHDIETMINDIKRDIGILNGVMFYPDVESRFMTGGLIPFTDTLMSDIEYLHFVPNQELYWVAKFQKDIKYLGTTGRRMPTQYSILVMERNPYWLPIMRELRGYIQDTRNEESFHMASFLSRPNSPPFALEYLRQICS